MSETLEWKPEYTTRALELIARDDRGTAIRVAVSSLLDTIGSDVDRWHGTERHRWTQVLALNAPDVEVPAWNRHLDLGEKAEKILDELRAQVEQLTAEAIDRIENAASEESTR